MPKPTEYEEDDAGEYALAGGAKKAKPVRVRQDALPGVGVSAEGVAQAVAPTRKTHTAHEILAAFRGEIAPVRPSVIYSLWLLIIAGFMILLPLIYFALIGLVVFGLWYHVVHDAAMVQHARGAMAKRLALFVYVVPLICGVVTVAFMLKPLFARPAKGAKGRELDPQSEPLVFAFVDGVCKSVGAPAPSRIEVDCTVNAAAGHSGGAFSLFNRQPFLVIGLGLVCGLDLKQFAGVMAHELGHLSQGSGARLMDVIWSINNWFARVVYDRDEWDETLRSWSSGDNFYVVIIGGLGRFAVWLTRRVLWVLLHVGHLGNMVFLRQREFDADRYMARMIGAKAFAQTSGRTNELMLASQFAVTDLQSSWQARRLPDNFPKLILANVPQIPKETLAAYRKANDQAKTSLFDTHPADRDRITRAKVEEPGEGIFKLDGPATDVFRNFDSLARSVTFSYYRSMLGRDISKDQLYPVAELVETQTVAQEGYVAAERFFLKALPITERLPLSALYPKAPDDAKDAKQALIKARNDQQAAREQCLAARERDTDIYARALKAEAAWMMLKCGVKVQAASWGLRAPTVKAAESARDKALDELQGVAVEFSPCTLAAARRLTLALAMLELDAAADRARDGRERREEARALYPCVAHLGANVVSQLVPVFRARQVLELVITKCNDVSDENERNAVRRAAGNLREKLEQLRWKVGDAIDYPFDHADENITLGRFALLSSVPDQNDIGGLLAIAQEANDRLLELYRRALGRLTVTAEEVERILGLKPIVVDEGA